MPSFLVKPSWYSTPENWIRVEVFGRLSVARLIIAMSFGMEKPLRL